MLASSAAAMAVLATGCGGSSGSSGSSAGGSSGSLTWWDHFSSFKKLNDNWASTETKALGTTVTHTYYDASKAPEAFQLAHQANKLPDVYSNVIGLPLPALVDGNWVHELQLPSDTMAKLPKNVLTEGITSVGNKLYGFPLFSFRQRTGLIWFNKDHFTKAGLDPANPPTSYSEIKDACNKLKGAGIVPLTMALGADGSRVGDETDDMAQVAGFPGYQGLRFDTGQYDYQHDSYVQVIEFLKELSDAKYLLPGTNNMGVVDSRTRFASGSTGLYFDGIWCAGGCKALVPAFADKIGSGTTPKPDSAQNNWTYRGRPSASYFVSAGSKNPDQASKLIASFMDDAYQKGMIAAMDQPPLNLDLVSSSDALDAYKSVVTFCKDHVFLMPQAIVRNPDVSKAEAKRKPVTPTIGNIVQGYLGGSISDLKGALKKLSDARQADLESAVKSAQSEGAKVSLDDYAFKDWKPGQDYQASAS